MRTLASYRIAFIMAMALVLATLQSRSEADRDSNSVRHYSEIGQDG
jgi:hypothetical protein